MPIAAVFIALLLLPLVVAGLTLFCRRPLAVLRLLQVGVVLEALLIALAVTTYMLAAPSGQLVWHWFMLDALSVYHLLIMALVFLLGTAFVDRYFAGAIAEGSLTLAGAHKFAGLWLGALCSMVLVLISNNLGILWVGIEATTLMTAFLVCTHISAASLEAMWKYLVICSIGVACAFMGTLLVAAAAQPLCLGAGEELLWIQLWNNAAGIDEPLLQLGFLFLVVGYGTKAGLAPLHNWLPDAHSQAPAPVSAIFSGFLLNAALYCIMRYIPIVEAATGYSGWSYGILLVFGMISLVVAAAFIPFQGNLKRLLAYSSVEHVGIMVMGLGLGGWGTWVALFHAGCHSVFKTIAFVVSGEIGNQYGTYQMADIRGLLRRSPFWGICLLTALLVLIGVAPSPIFLSKLWITQLLLMQASRWVLLIFLLTTIIIFIAVLRQVLVMVWGAAPDELVAEPRPLRPLQPALILIPLLAVLCLGLFLPSPLENLVSDAARILVSTP